MRRNPSAAMIRLAVMGTAILLGSRTNAAVHSNSAEHLDLNFE